MCVRGHIIGHTLARDRVSPTAATGNPWHGCTRYGCIPCDGLGTRQASFGQSQATRRPFVSMTTQVGVQALLGGGGGIWVRTRGRGFPPTKLGQARQRRDVTASGITLDCSPPNGHSGHNVLRGGPSSVCGAQWRPVVRVWGRQSACSGVEGALISSIVRVPNGITEVERRIREWPRLQKSRTLSRSRKHRRVAS